VATRYPWASNIDKFFPDSAQWTTIAVLQKKDDAIINLNNMRDAEDPFAYA
jgi:hypothetical protein